MLFSQFSVIPLYDCPVAYSQGMQGRYSANTLGYQKNIFWKKLNPVKPKIQYSHSLLYEISTLDHRIESYAEGQLYVGLFEVCDHGQNNV